HIGLHVSRRNQPDLVAESGDLARPIVRPAARLHAHKTRRLPGEIGKQLGTAELAPHLNRPVRADAVNLENRLRQVQPDRDNLLHGTVLSLPERPTISSPWHRMPQSRGRSTPSTARASVSCRDPSKVLKSGKPVSSHFPAGFQPGKPTPFQP